MRRTTSALLLAVAGLLVSARAAHAYIDLAPTLAKVMSDARRIALIELAEVDRGASAGTFREVETLKGDAAPGRLTLAWADKPAPQPIVQWAEPNGRAVLFTSGNVGLVCIGHAWYAAARSPATGAWRVGAVRPDLPLAYYGPVSRLAVGVRRMQAGEAAVLTVVAYGADEQGASFELAMNRPSLPGLARVQRIRARLTMPPLVMASSSSPAYFVGEGRADVADLPALVDALKSGSPAARADAAEDVGWLGRGAAATGPALAAVLADASPRPRLAAAAALLRVGGKPDAAALGVLKAGLASADVGTRRAAARSAGLAGPAAAPLAMSLAGLLKDADGGVKYAALQAVSTLGPVAADAAPAVAPLLEDPTLAADAADALGRIGPVARAALPRLAGLLASEDAPTRWAAVRGMAQIGGDGARPAADFMAKALATASEVDGYNMMIYLALLGPVARDAAPAIRAAPIKNPVLPTATLWAIEPDKEFPWNVRSGGPFGGRAGPPGMGGDAGPDFARFIYESYVRELGDRLRPAAKVLAARILAGTAGDVPNWGYKILSCSPEAAEQSLAALTPALAGPELAARQRATVALGHMGPAAAPAKPKLEAALAAAQTEREKKLLQWCLREVDRG